MGFYKSMRTDSAMATDKKNNPSARKRALLAIVAIVIIVLDIWWVASGQTHDVFFPQPAAEAKPARKMYVELCGPLSGDMEWGITLRPEVYNFPQGAIESRFWEISRDQGATWQPWDCEPDELTQWVVASEDTVGCLIRVTEYAVLEDGSDVSCTSAPFGPIEEQRGFSLQDTAAQGKGESALSSSSVPAEPVVYVCESAGNAYYHTYDCDELSLLRQRGYPTSEMTLSEASKLYQPCLVCQR